jgi:hypothetical protein
VSGVIAARLPHAEGTRYQIALEEDWQELCATFPFDVEIVPTGEQSDVVGSAGEGTTETVLEFEPLRRLEVGQPVILDPDGQNQIYQVARLRLISTSWSGASSLVAHASARQLGRPEGGRIVGAHYLPAPHEPIFAPTDLGDQLPAGYIQIGVIKGTEFPIGIGTSQESRGHIAIYGMSGMGKTAISRRLIEAFGQHEFVLAMDTTGEYSSRFAFPLWQFGADPNWQQGDFDTVGPHVFERPGDAPSYAAKLVKAMMDHARLEYDQGVPSFRTVVFEEAHSFIPEWNFAVGDQDSAVRNTTRFIMQARKYGLRFVIVSQRTAVVSKSAISQCENYVVLRTIDQTSLEYLEAVIGSELRGALPSLNRYEALCVGPAFNADQPVIVTLDPP